MGLAFGEASKFLEFPVLPRAFDIDVVEDFGGSGLGSADDVVVEVAEGLGGGEVWVGDVLAVELGEALCKL